MMQVQGSLGPLAMRERKRVSKRIVKRMRKRAG